MGILPGTKSDAKTTTGKRRSTLDFSGLGPLKTSGTVGFSAFRDQDAERAKQRSGRKKSNGILDDSDDDDSDAGPLVKMEESDDKVVKTHLAPEDAKVTGELQAGIDRIRVGRRHSHLGWIYQTNLAHYSSRDSIRPNLTA